MVRFGLRISCEWQSRGQNGYVMFDAPSGFDFGTSCTARDLPEPGAQNL